MPSTRVFRAPKVPEVFLLFWVVKLLTTGIGESGSDFLGTLSIPLAALVGRQRLHQVPGPGAAEP